MRSDYMHFLEGMPQQLMRTMSFTWHNGAHIFAFVLCNTLGYLLYTRSNKMISKEGKDPYPVWLHCWMITIDTLGTITFVILALRHHFFWVFDLYVVGLPIWMVMEARSIIFAVKHARQMEFGRLERGPVSERRAWFYVLGQVAVSFSVNLWVLSCLGGLGNAAIFIVWPFTNFVFAYWTWRFWTERAVETGTREYNSLGLQIIIAVQITVQWVPGLSWWWGVSPFFHQPFYLLIGAACSVLAFYNLYKCAQLPAKPLLASGAKPVW